jgi:hypothetical protein
MSQITYKSAGVTTRVINRTGPTSIRPAGIPAGVIGTSQKGPAFVPVTLPTDSDFVVDFGTSTDDQAAAPMAAIEWLRNSQALTFLRVLGAGSGKAREDAGDNSGRVVFGGFVVGAVLPQAPGGGLDDNQYVTVPGEGDEGRTFVLGCYMKQTGSSTIFSDAGLPIEGVPVVRGIVFAASGVYATLSSSRVADNAPDATGTSSTASGSLTGSLNIANGRQEFVVLLNGHSNPDPAFPNVITASFDPTAPNYLTKVLNTDPYKVEQAGHLLYADYKIHPALATPTGSGVVLEDFGVGAVSGALETEDVVFLLTSASPTRNSGSTTIPSFENFEDRYRTAESVYVVSQKFGGQEENLFKISALSDGKEPNSRLKFSIENIIPGTDAEPYGKFDLLVRDFNDNDKAPVAVEAWRGLSLNPDSPQYVARIVGDTKTFFNFDAAIGSQKLITEGNFENNSRYMRVEMANKVSDGELSPAAVPFGFRGVPHLVTSGSAPFNSFDDGDYLSVSDPFFNIVQLPVPLRERITRGSTPNRVVDKALYWGIQFEEKTSVAEPNLSTAQDTNILSFNKYYPNFHTDFMNMVLSNNQGVADSAENGILDADRFNHNKFSLGNIQIAINAFDKPNTQKMDEWIYVRDGNVTVDSDTRALSVNDLTDAATRNVAKFSFFLHGGFDGTNVFDRDAVNMTDLAVTEEMTYADRGLTDGPTVAAFNKALDIFEDVTEIDIQMMAVPGIRHTVITDRALLVNENRFDSVFIMDVPQYDIQNLPISSSNQILSVKNTSNQHTARGINSSFGAAYFPDVVLRDSFTGRTRVVPPSVAVLGAFAKNDAVAHPWFAPAGFTRGSLDTVESAAVRLSKENMDTLQDANINPLVSFAGSEGVVVWGQKTLLQTESSLDRVNVRRLLIDIRRKVKAVGYRMLFEQGREETLARFAQLTTPILKAIQDQKGVERFLVKIDTTTTTQADLENRIIRGSIFITPSKTLETVSIDFVVTNQV